MNYIDIYEYIKLSKQERQKHLDLNENCIEIGSNSTQIRGHLALILKTTIPKGSKIHCCHACNNQECSNYKHLYWGTAKENSEDFNCSSPKRVYKKPLYKNDIKGRKFFTNGNKDILIDPNGIIPEGFILGKTLGKDKKTEEHKKKISIANSGKMHYNNGIINIIINKNDIIPDGFKRGLIKKTNKFKNVHSSFYGKTHSVDTIEKMRETFKNTNHQKGHKNSQYGKMWITDGLYNKLIYKNDPIPDNWKKGRFIK
jgi:NUMOD3 motif